MSFFDRLCQGDCTMTPYQLQLITKQNNIGKGVTG